MPLPLAQKPFTAPTDRDMLPSERRAFVRTHRGSWPTLGAAIA
ncbi:MAG: hypothetical protein QOD88_278 [Mycobacterium sp.]|jgi:hypothetical protein|nr:hypothetical protein [Mycobacterium sp.]